MSKPMSREWIRIRHRNTNEYIQGVRYFMEFVKSYSPPDFGLCSCPCIKCRNSKKLPFKTVEKHLIIHGMDPTYDEWFFHGERSDNDVVVNPMRHVTYERQNRIGTAKSNLRKKYLKTKEGDILPRRLAINKRPEDIDKVQWERFIDIGYTDKKMKQCKTNADNKGKNTVNHTLGRKSYARLYEEFEMDNPECKITRTKVWKVAHTSKKTGEVLPCAAEKYALIEAAEERQKSEASVNGDDGIRSLEDFDKDPIIEVFGDDKRRSYCRGISSTSNVKQVKLSQASKAIINYKDNANQQWKTEMLEEMKTMSLAINDMRQCIKMLVNHIGGNATTPRAEAASNTEQDHSSLGGNLGASLNEVVGSSTREKQPVKLLSVDLMEVAKGQIGTQKICHDRKVVKGEQVVWVEDVLDPEASIYKAPQNGHYTLSELVGGGFVIWSEDRLRY